MITITNILSRILLYNLYNKIVNINTLKKLNFSSAIFVETVLYKIYQRLKWKFSF